MNQDRETLPLTNWEIVSGNPANKNWRGFDLFCFWSVSIQSVIGFSLFAALYLSYNLNSYAVLFGSVLAVLLIYIFSYLIGKPSQKHGLPFVVLLRSSLGINGAKYFGLIRFLVGVFLFGNQTYFLSKAFSYLIRIAIFSLEDRYLKVISNGRLDEAPSFVPNNKMVLFASKKIHKGILVATSNDGRIRQEIELTGEDVREPIWSN